MTGSARPPADGARQLATCLAALAQVALPLVLPPRFALDEQPPDVLQPAAPTFVVWLPIFATSLGYAGYQAQPSVRDQALARRVGWPLAAAFACTGAWAPLVRGRRYWPAQAALVGIAVGAETARRRLSAYEGDVGLDRAQRLVVATPTGMLAAWGAAAAGVNLAAMLRASGLLRPGWSTVVAGDLLVLGLGAAGASRVRRDAPVTSRAYAATLVWALLGIAAGQRRTSPSAALSAVAAAAVVLAAPGRRRTSHSAHAGPSRRAQVEVTDVTRKGRRAGPGEVPGRGA